MKVKWLGHSAFLITANDGTKIITDPYSDYAGIKYKPIDETADIVLASHKHGDHFGGKVKGNPGTVVDAGSKVIKGIQIKGIATYHDTSKGRERGSNIVFCFTVDGLKLCHLGDLGHDLSDTEIAEIGPVDILMIPVGGLYTIDSNVAGKICDKIKPGVVMPMHYKTGKLEFPISGVEGFLKGKTGVKKLAASEVEFQPGKLPGAKEIIVLQHAL